MDEGTRCQCDERQSAKETRLIDERFVNVMGECVI